MEVYIRPDEGFKPIDLVIRIQSKQEFNILVTLFGGFSNNDLTGRNNSLATVNSSGVLVPIYEELINHK